ncbi:protein-disulfide reductase DsbD domain-containing protein [Pseudogemmobacter sonorensis]|uniref:protein-disulfide reductase DsbD domain-containing protein n=1 Tax=Pseudogemmobacter sonorensis TaxID=2989681 RepID=UPI0036B79821
MTSRFRIRALPLCLAALLAGLHIGLPMPVHAFGTGKKQVVDASVLTGWQSGTGHVAGLRLDLAPGWKTYWRSPGSAGIPPVFDWSASENLASIRVLWPSPSIFDTNGTRTIGYRGHVVFPVEVVARDPSRPVTLRANVSLGVCDRICLPATVEASGMLIAPGAPDPAIRAAIEAQPVPGAIAGLGAVSCTVEPIRDGLRITARLSLPAQGGREAVVIENADPQIWVSESVETRKGGTLTAMADMVPPSGQPFALDRSGITVTVISERGAVEVKGCPAP